MTTTQELIQSALNHIDAHESDLGWTDDSLAARAALNEAIAALQASAEAQPSQEQIECRCCGGTGRMVRDPDIGTDQECFACDGNGTYLEAPQAAHPQPSAPVAQAVPAEWRKFVEDCAKTAGGMVNGNNLSRLAFRLLSTAPQVEQVEAKDGWKLVPTQITEEMHVAAVREIQQCSGNDDFPRRVFAAMLAAAPSSQKEGEQKNG